MAITRIFSIIRKEFIQITRDRRTLIFTLLMPIIQMVLLGYAANSDVKNVPLAVLDQSRTAQSRALLDAFRTTGYFVISWVSASQSGTPDRRGRSQTGLIIPGFRARSRAGKAFRLRSSLTVRFVISAGSLAAAQLIGQTQSADAGAATFAPGGQLVCRARIQSHAGLVQPDMVTTIIMIRRGWPDSAKHHLDAVLCDCARAQQHHRAVVVMAVPVG
jgi:ABC-2 type transport system permease protein